MIDLNYTTLEKLMKMAYTYETLTLVDAGISAVPELVGIVKRELENILY
jgi:hypothetical protein